MTIHRFESAIQEIRQGRVITPIKPGGKSPLLIDWPNTVCNEYEVGQWFDADSRINIAVIAGRSRLKIIDADNEDSIRLCERILPPTPMIAESPSGRHYYFREEQDDPHTQIRVDGMKLDILRGVRYVLLTPSYNAEKRRGYRWIKGPVPTGYLPTLPDELFPRKEVQPAQKPLVSSPDMNRVIRYVERVDPAVSGQGGHNKTFWLACRLRTNFPWLTYDQLLSALLVYNERCQPPWSDKELRHKCDEAFKR